MNGPPDCTYFTDRDLGHQFPRALRAAGLDVETHDEHFGPLTPDEQWLADVGRHGWIAITRDQRIRYSPLALGILMESGTKLFVLVGKLSTTEAVDVVVKRHKQMQAMAAGESGAFIAKVRRDGVHLWWPRDA